MNALNGVLYRTLGFWTHSKEHFMPKRFYIYEAKGIKRLSNCFFSDTVKFTAVVLNDFDYITIFKGP